jgi:hypothetical protein
MRAAGFGSPLTLKDILRMLSGLSFAILSSSTLPSNSIQILRDGCFRLPATVFGRGNWELHPITKMEDHCQQTHFKLCDLANSFNPSRYGPRPTAMFDADQISGLSSKFSNSTCVMLLHVCGDMALHAYPAYVFRSTLPLLSLLSAKQRMINECLRV